MARPGISRDQVFETAESLLLEGQTPTVVAVRTRLGGGSPNTITPLLAEWKALRETAKVEVLPPLPEPVEAAMRQVWGAAWKAAQAQLETERETLGNMRQDIERERMEMLGEIQRLDSALDEAQGETRKIIEALDAERLAHEQTRADAREARALAGERNKRIEEQGSEVREARRQVAETSSQVVRLESDLTHAREGLASAKAEAQREADARAGLAQDLDEARREIEGLKRDLADRAVAVEQARSQAQQAEDEAARLRSVIGDLTVDRDTAFAERAHLSVTIEQERKIAEQMKVDLDLKNKKFEKVKATLYEEHKVRSAAQKALAELRVEVATLTERAARGDELRQILDGMRRSDPDQA